MNLADTAKVLAKAAAFDARTVGDTDVLAWHEALDDLELADCLTAVTRHYRQSRDRLMAVDIRTLVAKIRQERLTADCPLHEGQPAHNCACCRSEAIAADVA